ncbi:molybdate ABC transporter substrate-binding protein [uncultured Methanomethylovorans sp.]|uniref:molybdate ABC transporter substrate-binding protein n=1 Tax=uncultured Methanomethylovorans sp. TaxID=183759 RepID=UPI002AA8246A|nr:molybdate ABC transporter substrate-binding protein [uncultured Methanomethylovorans sp.]
MSNKTRIILIAIMLVAAVFLSGCVDDKSATEDQSSEKITEKANSAIGQNNVTDDKKMSVPEDIDNNMTNATATASSFNVTNTTNTTSTYTYYSSGSSSSKSSGSSSKSSDSSETDTITVTDDLGRSITVPYPCERTVFLVENAMNTMYAVGGANDIVGIGKVWAEDVKAPFFKAIDSNYTVKKISNGTAQPSTETIATVNPQLVFLWASDWESADIKAIEETLNVPVYAVYIDSLDDLQNQITTFSKLIGKKEQGEKVIDVMDNEMDKVTDVTNKISDEEKPTVYWMWGDVYGTAGKTSTANDLIERSGGINVIDEWDNSSKNTEHPVLNLETLLKLNPDVIYMWYNANLDPQNITSGDNVNGIDFSDWSQLDAVKNGRVYEFSDHFVYDFHTPRLPLAMMYMAKDLYPTQFADMDLTEEADQYFVDIYGVHYPGYESAASTTQDVTDQITVSAAASLTEAFTDMETEFEAENPDIDVVCNFAASGTLRTQIEGGAPVDVFASAAEDQMDTLASKGFIYNDTREDFAKNSLVMIVPKGNTLGLTGMQDLTKSEVEKISIGNPDTVPAGKYAKEGLTIAGLWDSVSNKTLLAENVKQALVYVETGEAEAGFVFSTDASSAKNGSIEVITSVPVTTPITYPIAIVSSTQHEEDSQLFIDFVTGEKGESILEQYGFSIPQTG